MAAFVGTTKCYDWFKWACDAGICKSTDEVERLIVDVGIEDVVRVYIQKHGDERYTQVRLPAIEHVQRICTEVDR